MHLSSMRLPACICARAGDVREHAPCSSVANPLAQLMHFSFPVSTSDISHFLFLISCFHIRQRFPSLPAFLTNEHTALIHYASPFLCLASHLPNPHAPRAACPLTPRPRVILPNSSGCNYINASKVQLQPPHTGGPTSYIATQGPLPQTAEHFWRMVLESRTPAVVMLTNCIEKGTIKCAQYFPTARGEAAAFGALQLQVLLHERFSADCDRRTMRITDASTGSVLELQHFHYHTWPDHGVPEDSATLRRMCRELQRLRSGCGSGCASSGSSGADCGVGDRVSGTALAVMETGTPVLHCSAGIGRTGTFIAVDVILRRIDAWFRAGGPTKEEVEEALDMPRLVHSLRQQRFGMVQTLEQYCFVYKATLDELEERQQQHQGAVAAARAAAGGSGAQGRG